MGDRRTRTLEPILPRTKLDKDGSVLLVLDNGVRIESRSRAVGAGAYVLVVDAEGYEIGYWNAEEWRDRPASVMGAMLALAARGAPEPVDFGEPRSVDVTAGPKEPVEKPKAPTGAPFVIEKNDRQFLKGGTLKPVTSVGPKKSGSLQEFEKGRTTK